MEGWGTMRGRDFLYLSRRVEQESAAAEAASCERARAIHLDLAERYQAMLRAGELAAEAWAEDASDRLARDFIVIEPPRRQAS